MNDNSQAGKDCSSELQMVGLVRSLSEWAELDAPANAQVSRSVLPEDCDSEHLIRLQEARRFLNVRIEDEHRIGMPTADLERELEVKRVEARFYLAYLEHARDRI